MQQIDTGLQTIDSSRLGFVFQLNIFRSSMMLNGSTNHSGDRIIESATVDPTKKTRLKKHLHWKEVTRSNQKIRNVHQSKLIASMFLEGIQSRMEENIRQLIVQRSLQAHEEQIVRSLQ